MNWTFDSVLYNYKMRKEQSIKKGEKNEKEQ